MQDYISIDKRTYKELKSLYQTARNEHKKAFFFQGKELLTDYAKYLIQHIELNILPRLEEQ